MAIDQQVQVTRRRAGPISEGKAVLRREPEIVLFEIHGNGPYRMDKVSSSGLLMYQTDNSWYKVGVDIEDIRRARLREAAETLGGPANLAKKIERSDSQVSQIIGKNPTRNIGRELARELERKLEREPYWLDRQPDRTPPPAARKVEESQSAYADKELSIIIDQWPLLDLDQRKRLAADALIASSKVPVSSPTDTHAHRKILDFLKPKKRPL